MNKASPQDGSRRFGKYRDVFVMAGALLCGVTVAKAKNFLSKVDDARVIAAIEAAGLKSSGAIRVVFSNELIEDVMSAGQVQFTKLGMASTKRRNDRPPVLWAQDPTLARWPMTSLTPRMPSI